MVNCTQSVALGYIPFGLSARLCCVQAAQLLANSLNGTAFSFKVVYFVVVNNVEEINNEIKQKTRKCVSDIKKPKNVDVLTKTAKRNAL